MLKPWWALEVLVLAHKLSYALHTQHKDTFPKHMSQTDVTNTCATPAPTPLRLLLQTSPQYFHRVLLLPPFSSYVCHIQTNVS